ncbi:MAG TPA: cupin domain-containing protein, partial [Planctomycetota bacterium]|nr:cupin domain-containing protein [Planctomycetota bacterium]
MDPLDAILDALRLESAVAGIRDFGAPFGVRVRTGAVAAIHFIVSGSCTAQLAADGASRQLGPGDAILLPHGSEHEVRDHPQRAVVDSEVLATCPVIDGRVVFGGKGPRTAFLCGGFRFARGGAHRLLDDLPALVVTSPSDGTSSPAMVAIQQAMAHEYGTGTAGQTAAVKALMHAWFVAFLRTWIANQ